MSNKIINVEEVWLKYNRDIDLTYGGEEAMIEFAKLHVKAALKAATESVEEYRAWGDKDKIKNSYPLKNIK